MNAIIYIFILSCLLSGCTSKIQETPPENVEKQPSEENATEACLVGPTVDNQFSNFDFSQELTIPTRSLEDYRSDAQSSFLFSDKVKEGKIVQGVKTNDGYKLHFSNIPPDAKKIEFYWLPVSRDDAVDSFYPTDGQSELESQYAYDFEGAPILLIAVYGQNEQGEEFVLAVYIQDLRGES